MPTRPREVSIELTEGEYIVPRGKREITWLVQLNDDWIHISQWPAAEVERCQATSGTVWENRTQLQLLPGTGLQRIESRPAPYEQRDTLDYLKRAPSGVARRVIRQEFRVGQRGDLLRNGR